MPRAWLIFSDRFTHVHWGRGNVSSFEIKPFLESTNVIVQCPTKYVGKAAQMGSSNGITFEDSALHVMYEHAEKKPLVASDWDSLLLRRGLQIKLPEEDCARSFEEGKCARKKRKGLGRSSWSR